MARLQLRLAGNGERIFKHLVDLLSATPKDVVLDALALLHYAAEQIGSGHKIGSYDPESKEFTAMTTPSLEALASRVRARRAEQATQRAAAATR